VGVTSRDARDQLDIRALLAAATGRAIDARRKATVEPAFGQIRSARWFQQFSW